MSYKPYNILVTGGAGFIGSHFIRYYQTYYPGAFILNLDKLTYAASLTNLKQLPHPDKYHFIQGDILDNKLIADLLRDFKIDTIVHFAAETHVDRSIHNPAIFVQTNILGTFNLLENSRNYWLEELKLSNSSCRFHHISTDEVYGSLDKNQAAFTELTPYRPNSPYSSSKAAADHLVRSYYHTYKLPISITHCSNNYGPLQHNEKFIPTIINGCLKQIPLPVYGDGSNIRDWIFVEDHCCGISEVIHNAEVGETYNIGGNNELSNLEVIYKICELFNKAKPIDYCYTKLIHNVKDRAGHDWRYAIDIEKISKALNWHPKESFSSGIFKTFLYYQQKEKNSCSLFNY